MAEGQTKISDCWPTKREAFNLGVKFGHLLAEAEFHKMQQPSYGQGLMQSLKVWVERYELASKLWALRRPAGLTLLIASWWEHILWLVRHIVG
jgi:hypothetical protein